jgi:tyrosine-protein kinase Etk/Wzc
MEQSDNKYVEVAEKETNMVEQIAAKYLPYWPLLILFVLLSLSAAYAFLRYATPVYEANAKIIIKDDKRGSDDSRIMDQFNLIASNKSIENELEVLQSRALMEDVVKKLFLYAPIWQQGKVKKSDAYLLSPIVVQARNTDSMVETEKVNFNYDSKTKTVLLEGKDKYPINQFVTTAYGVLRFTPNPNYLPSPSEADKQFFFELGNPSVVASYIILALKVASAKQSAILDLSYKDVIAQRAVNILNTLIKTYDVKSIEEKNILSINTLSFITERLNLLERDLDSIEKKVQHYKAGTGSVNLGDQATIFLQKVAAGDQKLSEVDNQLDILNQVENYVTKKSGEGGIVPSTLGIGDQTLSNLTTKLYNSELEYGKLKQTMGENNPKMIALADEIKKIRPSIIENIKSQQSNLGATRQNLYSSIGTYNSMLRSVPGKDRQLMDISREQQTKNNLYNFLLQKKSDAELSLASILSNSRVVDKAMAGEDPVSPKKKMIYAVAIIGALGLFVGFIFMKDAFTGKIKYRNEIEKMTAIPIIGEIAFEKTNSPLVIEKGTRSFVAEEFRKLRISLSFLGIDAAHKKILLTSSISGEGKSFIAANLAVSLSLTGKKVVLVDLDLNNPSLSKILGVDYEYGITEFLEGEKKPADIINKLSAYENMYFVAAGSLQENPTELLANGTVKSLIDYLETNFDMVIIDTSPAVLVTDAYILSEMCDATLYVIRHDYTPKMLVKRIDENNQINPINNPAIIFNGVKTRGVFKNNYGYGYDYVYGNKERSNKTKKAS